ncbi:FBN1 [Cordylochernes scorpioides]|uniref:FBN1 n=1 Tax=Cordylochernes scorpioides TaxID=51811 RepID=A0ABY6K6M5_9ARAC|nr:FBN1 [Cordylochernes scorpioides]
MLCCATIGVAWGHPCEHCPATLQCERGYLFNTESNTCQAVVADIDECEDAYKVCYNGRCANTPGGYNCICDNGYVPSQDRKACLVCLSNDGCTDTRQGICYTEYSVGQCRNPLGVRLTKLECCCGENMGQGWGSSICEACPLPKTGTVNLSHSFIYRMKALKHKCFFYA